MTDRDSAARSWLVKLLARGERARGGGEGGGREEKASFLKPQVAIDKSTGLESMTGKQQDQ